MKIITKKKAYVQISDLSYLSTGCAKKDIPVSVIKKVSNEVYIFDDSRRYNFVEFNKPEQVEFFRNLYYSVDFLTLSEYSDVEIQSYIDSIFKEQYEVAKKFNEMSDEEKEKNLDMIARYKMLDFKRHSVKEFIRYKSGELKFDLPKEVLEMNQGKPTKKGLLKFFKKR